MFEYRAFLSCNKEPLRGHDSTQDLVASMEAEAMVAKVDLFINFILIIMIIMEAEAMVAKMENRKLTTSTILLFMMWLM